MAEVKHLDILDFVNSFDQKLITRELSKQNITFKFYEYLCKKYGKNKYDWNEKDFERLLESDTFFKKNDTFKNYITRLISFCINVSAQKNFEFGKDFKEKLFSLGKNHTDYFLDRNNKSIVLKDWDEVPNYFAENMEEGSINIDKCGKIGKTFARNMKNGTIKVGYCGSIGESFASSMKGGTILIEQCNSVGDRFANKIEDGTIDITIVKKEGNLHIEFWDGEFILEEKTYFDNIIRKVKSFLVNDIHPKLEVKYEPYIKIKQLDSFVDGAFIPPHKIMLNSLRINNWEATLPHEYIHFLLIKLFEKAYILKYHSASFSAPKQVKAVFELFKNVNETTDHPFVKVPNLSSQVKVLEGLTDFLTNLYCKKYNIPIPEGYPDLVKFTEEEFEKKLERDYPGEKLIEAGGWLIIKNAVWRDFFDYILGGQAEELYAEEVKKVLPKLK